MWLHWWGGALFHYLASALVCLFYVLQVFRVSNNGVLLLFHAKAKYFGADIVERVSSTVPPPQPAR